MSYVYACRGRVPLIRYCAGLTRFYGHASPPCRFIKPTAPCSPNLTKLVFTSHFHGRASFDFNFQRMAAHCPRLEELAVTVVDLPNERYGFGPHFNDHAAYLPSFQHLKVLRLVSNSNCITDMVR